MAALPEGRLSCRGSYAIIQTVVLCACIHALTYSWCLQGVEPVLRTYNTLIIACNMCNQPREAMAVHRRMLNEGYTPNATTYNALISAYGKAGQLDKVMEVRALHYSWSTCFCSSPCVGCMHMSWNCADEDMAPCLDVVLAWQL